MMNKELFPTDKDAEIARLRRCIGEFNEYDKKRTEQYKQLVKENQWLNEEIELITSSDRTVRRVREQRSQLTRLNGIIAANRMRTDFTPEDLDNVRLHDEIESLRKRLEKDKEIMRKMKDAINSLVYRLQKYEGEANG